VSVSATHTAAGPRRRLCAHADADGHGMHWLAPGQTCPAARAATSEPTGPADLTQAITQVTAWETAARSEVTVRTWTTGQPGGFRIEFTRTGRPETAVVMQDFCEVAMALNLSGQPITTGTDPARVADLVMVTVDRVGLDRISELSLIDRAINLLRVAGQAPPAHLARQRALWSDRRSQACVNATYRLEQAVERGEFGEVA
jgi:hypothetical protein